MKTSRRITGIALLIAVVCKAVSVSAAQAGTASNAAMELRLVTDSGRCPTAIDVWLTRTTDSIQGLEIYLAWDRSNMGLFETKKVPAAKPNSTKKDSTSAKPSTGSATSTHLEPRIDRSQGLLKPWEFVAARGEDGLSVKVTAIAYLLGGARPRPICPGDTGLLFSLPISIVTSRPGNKDTDSAMVVFDRQRTRFSDTRGKLFDKIDLRDGVVDALPCRKPRKP